MKAKIELVANVLVILLAVVIGTVFLRDRFDSQSVETDDVKPGDKFASIDGWDWSTHDQTLVLVLRKGCHFCEDSAPFYQRLLAQQQQRTGNTSVVTVSPDSAEVMKDVLQSEGLRVHLVGGVPLDKLRVSGTPTLLLIDRGGVVRNAWIGMLSPRQELDVIRATTRDLTSERKVPDEEKEER